MMARSTRGSNQRPDTLMQDRTSANSMKVLLQRTAGPYIRVTLGHLAMAAQCLVSRKPDTAGGFTRPRPRGANREACSCVLGINAPLRRAHRHPIIRCPWRPRRFGCRVAAGGGLEECPAVPAPIVRLPASSSFDRRRSIYPRRNRKNSISCPGSFCQPIG
jgi:hypothetical protein